MCGQTIALFRYLSPGILNRRLLILLAVLLIAAGLLSSFIYQLAIIHSREIAIAILAALTRYSFVLLSLLLITANVAEDFESKQFERLLTMPIARWQYFAAQLMTIACLITGLSLLVFIILLFLTSIELSLYWAIALWLEMLMVSLLGLLAILALEKIPSAIFLTLSIYFLAKLSDLIGQMLSESVYLSDGALPDQFSEWIFSVILYVIPNLEAFAQNDAFFGPTDIATSLLTQAGYAGLYSLFLMAVCLIDFYRKEFNF